MGQVRACKKCVGVHEYQDSVYGKGNRVFTSSGGKECKEKCTVCGNEHMAFSVKKK